MYGQGLHFATNKEMFKNCVLLFLVYYSIRQLKRVLSSLGLKRRKDHSSVRDVQLAVQV